MFGSVEDPMEMYYQYNHDNSDPIKDGESTAQLSD
jgi:hypothetical protein